MTAEQFVERWRGTELSERAASHEHFIDLCRLIGQPTPAEADPTGAEYCFEKSVKVVGSASKGSKGDGGFVDVWKRGCFAWEYKRKDKYKDLDEAYRQLYQYRDALDNPPLSVVCDINTFVIRTHFAGYPTAKQVIQLEELPGKLEVLRRIFNNPESFRPHKDREQTTKEIAEVFAEVANVLIERHKHEDHALWKSPGDPVAHFLMKVMFCLFAEDIGQLPPALFTKLIDRCLFEPENFQSLVAELFDKMKKGGWYGSDRIEYFNGGLFDDAPPLPLKHGELHTLRKIAEKPWAGVEPTIFGTLFERILDPDKRAQIGAHYTSKEDILLVVDPVVMTPLRREWDTLKEKFAPALEKHDAETNRKKRDVLSAPIKLGVEEFRRRLSKVRVLDPACGSGNFLYVALQRLLDLEDEIVRFCALHDIYVDAVPRIRPTQMHGIEINPYAAELAQVVIWIGYLQWLHEHHIDDPRRPILDKLQCIDNRDAILALSPSPLQGEGRGEGRSSRKSKASETAKKSLPADWPEADFIIGNPPFLGSKVFRSNGLSNEYVQAMYDAFDLPKTSDLCCYWFELARRVIEKHPKTRVGLLATQGIRGGDNRTVLERIKETGDIFMAWSDRDWILDGANVHVSIVGFSQVLDETPVLDAADVEQINADLGDGVDTASANALKENSGIAFMGDTKGGAFDVDWEAARKLMSQPNAARQRNDEVVRPWINGLDITRRPRSMFIIDFGVDMPVDVAAAYESPFAHVEQNVKPERVKNRRATYAERWWIHVEPRPAMRKRLPKTRFIATPNLTKFRLFTAVVGSVLPDHQLIAFARSDDYFFGVLHSSIHELWALRMGTQLEDRPRYTPTTCFETFALPWVPGKEPTDDAALTPALSRGEREQWRRISDAARELNELRERWLNPPEWIELLAKQIDQRDTFEDVPKEARELIRRSAIMAAAAKDTRLKKRTLTNLYNERPAWLRLAHEKLDRAVLAAYAATDPAGKWAQDWAAVWSDGGAGQSLGGNHPLAARRAAVDQLVLENLLRLNRLRSGS